MANNKKEQDKIKRKVKSKAKREAKKYAKSHPKQILIALLVIVLIVAIVFTAIYFTNRPLFNKIFGIKTEDAPATGGNLPSGEILGDKLEITFINVGQGDSILIRLPDGKTMMIDAGSVQLRDDDPYKDKGGAKQKIFDTLDKYKIKSIDAMLLTHGDADHYKYMPDIMESYEVKNIFVPDYDGPTDGSGGKEGQEIGGAIPTKSLGAFYEAAAKETYIENGETKPSNIIKNVDDVDNLIGENYSIKSYCRSAEYYDTVKNHNGPKLNSISPVTVLEYGGRKVMFMGDGEGEGSNDVEHWFIDKGIKYDIDVLKVGHHGSAPSASQDFLDYVDPEYAVISTSGQHKVFKHPRQETVDRLTNYKDKTPDEDYNGMARLYRTDLDGDIMLTIGGNGGMQWQTSKEQTQGVSMSIMSREYLYYSREESYALVA